MSDESRTGEITPLVPVRIMPARGSVQHLHPLATALVAHRFAQFVGLAVAEAGGRNRHDRHGGKNGRERIREPRRMRPLGHQFDMTATGELCIHSPFNGQCTKVVEVRAFGSCRGTCDEILDGQPGRYPEVVVTQVFEAGSFVDSVVSGSTVQRLRSRPRRPEIRGDLNSDQMQLN